MDLLLLLLLLLHLALALILAVSLLHLIVLDEEGLNIGWERSELLL
jgi:hypothetical protein